MNTQSPYRTVKQFVAENPAFTTGGLRFEIFNREINGLAKSGAILRRGRRVLSHAPRYFKWLDMQNGVNTDSADPNLAA